MSLYTVFISAKRKSNPHGDNQIAWKAQAELDPPSAAADLIKGRFLDLTAERLQALPGMQDVSLQIEGQRYRLISAEADGAFVGLRDTAK